MSKSITPIAACLFSTFAAGAISAQQPVILERHTVRDSMAVNQDAITFLKPRGWKVSGGIKWYLEFSHQACTEVKVYNPDGLEQIETLPWVNGTWFTNPVIPMKRGVNYMGNIVMPPIEDPKEVIRTLTLPQLRRGARITGSQEMPELAKVLSKSMGGAKVRSARVRVEYAINGQAVEEDFYLSVYVTSANLGVNNCVSYLWGPAWPPFSLRAAKGQLDAATPMLLAVVNSAQICPKWYGEYNFVCELFQDRMAKGIDNARRISEITRENSDAIFKMYSDSYWKRQASQDRLATQFSDYIRGVSRYQNPLQQYPVQLPSGYKYVWASPSGGYVLSNNAGYDPNVGSTSTWNLLKLAN